MQIETFAMERMQSLYEHDVEINLSESGVQPVRVGELLSWAGGPERLLDLPLGYTESAGPRMLREYIAGWYPGATAANVTVTNGGAEANYTTLWTLLDPGDQMAIMLPNYMQTWGLARAFADARSFSLRVLDSDGQRRWALDLDDLDRAVTSRTKLILVTNPNNPTGAVLTDAEMTAVTDVARRAGAWLLADEIYRGAELGSEQVTPTFWGRYEKTIVTAGLSKAFGMPGLRVGWILAPEALIGELWQRHDYLTIMVGTVSAELATVALEPGRRERLLRRTRQILRSNLPVLEQWIRCHADLFDYVPPLAGGVAFAACGLPVSTAEFAETLRTTHSVLVVPGEQLGAGCGLRFGYGHDMTETVKGLARIDQALQELATIGGSHA
jgi:aspartate/methionine/tyrosine aminotransferase